MSTLNIPSVKRIFTEVKVISEVIIDEECDGDLEFDLEHDLHGHFKVKIIFLNRNPFIVTLVTLKVKHYP